MSKSTYTKIKGNENPYQTAANHMMKPKSLMNQDPYTEFNSLNSIERGSTEHRPRRIMQKSSRANSIDALNSSEASIRFYTAEGSRRPSVRKSSTGTVYHSHQNEAKSFVKETTHDILQQKKQIAY